MGKITLHVLNTMSGCPAAGMRFDFYRLEQGGNYALIASLSTNGDGRLPKPLYEEKKMRPARYRLQFHAAEYFTKEGVNLPEPAFFESITVDFGVSKPEEHYHIPLLLSPYGYSTYRGS